jgi:hypothetical protein
MVLAVEQGLKFSDISGNEHGEVGTEVTEREGQSSTESKEVEEEEEMSLSDSVEATSLSTFSWGSYRERTQNILSFSFTSDSPFASSSISSQSPSDSSILSSSISHSSQTKRVFYGDGIKANHFSSTDAIDNTEATLTGGMTEVTEASLEDTSDGESESSNHSSSESDEIEQEQSEGGWSDRKVNVELESGTPKFRALPSSSSSSFAKIPPQEVLLKTGPLFLAKYFFSHDRFIIFLLPFKNLTFVCC